MRCQYFAVFWVMILMVYGLTGCETTMQNQIKHDFRQDAAQYLLKGQTILSETQQQLAAQNYLAHYLSPWTGQQQLLTNPEILKAEQGVLADFLQNSGFAQNQQPFSKAWVETIARNMNLTSFPNQHIKAITVHLTDVRLLPVAEPSFTALKPAWNNYPFDNLQVSILPANTPILVLQTTVDRAWVLVLAPNIIGWVPVTNIAYVNSAFIKHWQAQQWLAPLYDDFPVLTQQHYHFNLRLGALYPLFSDKNDQYEILIALADKDQQAVIEHAYLPKQTAVIFPFAATTDHFIQIINSQLGRPYGWGGLYGYRDCSSTLEDIFTPFGIWLPRNSKDQAMMGKVIQLKGLTVKQKQQLLMKKGRPLLTLVSLPGHIMLYINQQDGHAYVLQNAWGLHTQNWLTAKEGRRLIGEAFIAPMDYDESVFNPQSILARTNSINILGVN